MQRSLFMTCALLACIRTAPAPTDPDDVPPRWELSREVRPVNYRLELTLVPGRDLFRGDVRIEVDLQRPHRILWLHSLDLKIRDAFVELAHERISALLEQTTPEGLARLTPAHPLPAGRSLLHISFEGRWNEQLAGLSRVRVSGARYAFMQLAPAGARRAFPCFDDPAFKVPFEISLVVPDHDLAVSNSPSTSDERLEDGLRRVRFAPTPPLASHLVFAASGPFEIIEPPPIAPSDIRARPLPLRALVPRGSGLGQVFALGATRELLPILERIIGSPFPYAKLDHVVTPDGFGAESGFAGAVLHPEDAISLDLARSSGERLLRAGERIALGLASHWFGGSMSPASWDDAWLPASLATFTTWKALERWRPELGPEEEIAVEIDEALEKDALAAARPLHRAVRNAGELPGHADRHARVKGAALLRSFERLVGQERFGAGLREFTRSRAHDVGTTEAAILTLFRASDRNLATAFRSSLDEPGALLVEARTACDAPGPRVELLLERYRPLGSRVRPGDVRASPVCVRFEAAGRPGELCALVERGRGAIALPACPRWVMPNAGGTSYHRSWLAAPDFARLRDVGFLHLTPVERVSHAHSVRAAARAGRLPYAEALSALVPLVQGGARRVSEVPLGALTEAIEVLLPAGSQGQGRLTASRLVRPLFRELDAEPASHLSLDRRARRANLARFLVETARDPDIRRSLAASGEFYAGGGFRTGALPQDLAGVALAAAVAQSGRPFQAMLEQRLATEQDGALRHELLAAVASARDPDLSFHALELAGDSTLRVHERGAPLFTQAALPEARDNAWKTLQSRWSRLVANLGEPDVSRLPEVAAGLCDVQRLASVRRFLDSRVEARPGARRILEEVLERVELCAAFKEAQSASATSWFADK